MSFIRLIVRIITYLILDETTFGYLVEGIHNDINKHVNFYSVVSQHRLINNHDFKWSTSRILYLENHTQKREITEVFFIKRLNNNTNLQKDTENLNNVYNNVIGLS